MNKEFIPYKQAVALKKLGFDEPCLAAYFVFGDGKLREGRYGQTEPQLFINGINKQLEDREEELKMFAYYDLSVPLYQQAFRWFREKYILIYVIVKAESWFFTINGCNTQEGFNTYEEAELACLDKLIELTFKTKINCKTTR